MFLAIFCLPGCQGQGRSDVLAEVNGQPITRPQLERAMIGFGLTQAAGPKAAREVLEELIDQVLILQHAQSAGLSVNQEEVDRAEAKFRSDYTPEGFRSMLISQAVDYQDWRRGLADRLLIEKTLSVAAEGRSKSSPGPEAGVQAGGGRVSAKERIKLAQIQAETKAKAQAAREALIRGEAFEAVARRYSSLAGQAGQILDYFGQGEMPPELEKEVWPLKAGQVSQVVRSDAGFHVFLVLDRLDQDLSRREKAAREWQRQQKTKFQAEWIERLRREAKVRIYPDRLFAAGP